MRGIKRVLERIVEDVSTIYPVNVINRSKKPEYPFSTYNVLNVKTNVSEQGIIKTEEDNTYQVTQPQFILSVNSYSDDNIEAIEQARKVYHYFKWQNDLEELNVVVVNVGDITDRTVQIVDGYEFRYGFDVWIRYVDRIDKDIYNIEKGRVNEEYA